MDAYAIAVANGGNAATMLKEMEPDVPAEEDSGGVAQFMLDLSSKADSTSDSEATTSIEDSTKQSES